VIAWENLQWLSDTMLGHKMRARFSTTLSVRQNLFSFKVRALLPSYSTPQIIFMSPNQGVLKYESISKFFDSILDGTATLTSMGSQVPEDSHKLSPEEEEIERKQEAQRLALLHGGLTDMIDFEKAIKKHGTGFHGAHGYNAPPDNESENNQNQDTNKGEDRHEREEDPMHRAIRIQREKEEEERRAKDALQNSVPGAGDRDQVILEAHIATETTTPLSTATTSKVAPQTPSSPGMSISGSIVAVAPSDAPFPGETEVVLTDEDTPTPTMIHVKDEL
jgi:hypothetical protein